MTFTTDVVTETLHRIVAEKGTDYVYPLAKISGANACRYSEGGAPSCIVGHVIAALEPEVFQKIAEIEEAKEESTDARNLVENGWRMGYDFRSDTFEYETPALGGHDLAVALDMAQIAQDKGLKWGDAVEYYERYLAGGETYYDLIQEIHRRVREK